MSLASFLPRVKTRCVYSYYCCIFVSQMISHFGSSPYLSSSVYVFLRNFSLIMALDSFEPPDMFSFAPMLSVNARPPDGFVPPCIPRGRPASQFVHAGILDQPAKWEQFRSFLSQLTCRLAEQINAVDQTAWSDKPRIICVRKIRNLGSALSRSP